MGWLAVLLVGVAVADLAHSVRPVRHVPECVGAVVALGVGLLAGIGTGREMIGLLVVVAVVLAWGELVTRAFGAANAGRNRAWMPLLLLGGAVTLAVVAAPWGPEVDGVVGRWLLEEPMPLLAGVEPTRLLLVVAVLLVQMSTGNVLVRLVLAATNTVSPAQQGTATDPEQRLKGGRLLGPMERLLIVGLGLAGELTAAGLVIAAKGLLRFPELQSKGEQERIHQLTEYFLVGSFVSWLLALASVVVARA